ncbi:hypothetical protein CEXT_489671 [Caerostris extrusa]|uniref:Uncharacterized protein n=1 Tax=Caerostris extrusa TaxID=172846 RepID=A0AAV4M9E9_CAEEX|nr:hypothetical protein CEXT_489671 [Caerostris extrusa]
MLNLIKVVQVIKECRPQFLVFTLVFCLDYIMMLQEFFAGSQSTTPSTDSTEVTTKHNLRQQHHIQCLMIVFLKLVVQLCDIFKSAKT